MPLGIILEESSPFTFPAGVYAMFLFIWRKLLTWIFNVAALEDSESLVLF